MNAVSLPLARLRAWPLWRPQISMEALALLVSVFFSAACNGAFWRAYEGFGGFQTTGGWVTAVSLFVAMTGLNLLLLCVVLNRWTAKPLLTVLLLVTAFAVYYMNQYTVYLDPDMIRNVLHTDARESAELLTPGLALPLVLYAAIPIALVWRVRLRRWTPGRALLRRLAMMLLATVVTIGALMVSFQDISSLMRNHTEIRHLITPGNYLVSLARVTTLDSPGAAQARLPVGTDAQVVGRSESKPRLLVIVVGETVRAQNWGLNGYSRQTTPELAGRDVLNFPDVTACGSSTEVSLPCMFSAQGRRHYDKQAIKRSQSLLNVLDHAGIATLWRDNQGGCKGVCDGLPFESVADAQIPEFCDSEGCLDAVLLHDLQQKIDLDDRDQVVVLHQLGNHGPSYYRRYPTQFRQFTPTCETPQLGQCSQEEIVNAYDNAILYTDHFLAGLIDLLQADTARDTAMIYLSDHGESLGEHNLYLHGVPYQIAPPTQIKVPMVMWLSPGLVAARGIDIRCMQQHSAEPASHDNLFSSVLGLMQVRTAAYDPREDLFAACTIKAGA